MIKFVEGSDDRVTIGSTSHLVVQDNKALILGGSDDFAPAWSDAPTSPIQEIPHSPSNYSFMESERSFDGFSSFDEYIFFFIF